MRRLLFIVLLIAAIIFITQIIYFVFFRVRVIRYNEGQPLHSVSVAAHIHNVSALHHDGNNNVWIGTEKHGIYRFDVTKKESQPVSVPKELQTASVRSLVVDHQNRLWVGTSCHGLFIKNGEEWQHYDFGTRIFTIRVAPNGDVFVATENCLTVYSPELDTWGDIEIHPSDHNPNNSWQVADVTFDAKGNLFAGTICHGIVRLNRDDSGNYIVSKLISAKRRFGPGSTPNVSPVPLDPCGEGLPSNQINTILTSSDGTIWAGTTAGLTWSRDGGETWFFIRGRNYGDKIRGLLAGTPYKWKEISRVRFGELLPEDDIPLLIEDTNGILWIGTKSLGCVAIKPAAFYRETLLKSDDSETVTAFLEEMSKNSTRFYGTKTDQIVTMTQLADGKMMLASRSGHLETLEYPVVQIATKTVKPLEKQESSVSFPKPKTMLKTEPANKNHEYPYAAFIGADYVTQRNWEGHYGKTYALIGGGSMPHDKLIAFDETLCKVRPFVGFVGNRTRPLERITLVQSHAHHHHDTHAHVHDHGHHDHDHSHHGVHEDHEEHGEHKEHEAPHEHHKNHESVAKNLTAWSSNGNTVPKTYDGQHLWCEVKLNKPGRYYLSLFFVDPDIISNKNPRDYLIKILPEIPVPKIRTPKGDWQELGRRADEWAAEQTPLAVSRVTDFGNGVYQRFELAGAGTYYVKIDKNYSRKIDLCAIFIDRFEAETPSEMPEKTTEQTPDTIP
jgi:sugar lactone lactonase YvrE